jgi:hypothetical protein
MFFIIFISFFISIFSYIKWHEKIKITNTNLFIFHFILFEGEKIKITGNIFMVYERWIVPFLFL